VEGLENIPARSNFIAVSNHASYLDPFILGVAIPQKIRWIVMREVYYIRLSFVQWFIKKMGALPKGNASQQAMRILNEGHNIGIFPEGMRTRDGALNEFKRGAALLAVKSGRPILPCAIIGAFQAYPRGARFPRPYPLKVKIGKPVYLLKESDEVIDDIALQEGMFRVRNSIKEMLDAK